MRGWSSATRIKQTRSYHRCYACLLESHAITSMHTALPAAIRSQGLGHVATPLPAWQSLTILQGSPILEEVTCMQARLKGLYLCGVIFLNNTASRARGLTSRHLSHCTLSHSSSFLHSGSYHQRPALLKSKQFFALQWHMLSNTVFTPFSRQLQHLLLLFAAGAEH